MPEPELTPDGHEVNGCYYCYEGALFAPPPNDTWHRTSRNTYARCDMKPRVSFDPSKLVFKPAPEEVEVQLTRDGYQFRRKWRRKP